MRSHDPKFNSGRAWRVAIVLLGLVALTVSGTMLLDQPQFAKGGGDGEGGRVLGGNRDEVGAGTDFGTGSTGVGPGPAAAAPPIRGDAAGGPGVTSGGGTGATTDGAGNGPPAKADGRAGLGGGADNGPGTGGGSGNGSGASGAGQGNTNKSNVVGSFQSLSQPQQARVMQRCKDVLAAPRKAEPSQLALCNTLDAMARR